MINENISLSIIFPTLNEGDNLKYLIPEFVNVLRGINFENYELIIIDDGSTDNTKEVVDELQKETKLTFISRNLNLHFHYQFGKESKNQNQNT